MLVHTIDFYDPFNHPIQIITTTLQFVLALVFLTSMGKYRVYEIWILQYPLITHDMGPAFQAMPFYL